MTDEDMILQCSVVAAGGKGELPFGAIVTNADGKIVGQSSQKVAATNDLTRHAEICALAQAYVLNGYKALHGHTLYTSVEPCPMCSFAARLYQIDRVVFGLYSPVMGGWSHWPVLQDSSLWHSELGFFDLSFAQAPIIEAGINAAAAAKGWADWNIVAWEALQAGGIFSTSIDNLKKPGIVCT
jgi:tRNA(adenine34) deaminase